MLDFDWKPFLQEWSREILASPYIQKSPDTITSGWMGYSGATEVDMLTAENRLGCRLPPSYREFLKVSNGWQRLHHRWSDILLPIEQVDWLDTLHPDWIDKWEEIYAGEDPISDDEYLDYSEFQNDASFRPEYFRTALEIGHSYDDGILLLLNPQVVTSDGEWEAYYWVYDVSFAIRYRSFWDFMQDQREAYLRQANWEIGRYHPEEPSEMLPSKLPMLIAEIESRANFRLKRANRQESVNWPYVNGIVDGIKDGVIQIEKLFAQSDIAILPAILKKFAIRLDEEWRKRPIFSGDYSSGYAEGGMNVALVIRWFLEGGLP